jgi:hypothetical protein
MSLTWPGSTMTCSDKYQGCHDYLIEDVFIHTPVPHEVRGQVQWKQ